MIDSKALDILIESYKNAASRTRNVFIVLNLTTVLLLIGFYNQKVTWLRHKVDLHKLEKDSIKSLDDLTRNNDVEHYYNGEFRFINLKFVGAKIYYEDVPILGGLALSLIMTWFYFVRRRERGVIKQLNSLISTTYRHAKEVVKLVYYQISFNLVFNTISKIDDSNQKISKLIIRSLIALPTVILLFYIMADTYETFFEMQAHPTDTGDITTIGFFVLEKDWGVVFEIIIRLVVGVMLVAYNGLMSASVLRLSSQDAKFRRGIEEIYLKHNRENQANT